VLCVCVCERERESTCQSVCEREWVGVYENVCEHGRGELRRVVRRMRVSDSENIVCACKYVCMYVRITS